MIFSRRWKFFLSLILAGVMLGGILIWNIGGVLVASANRAVGLPPENLRAKPVEFLSASGARLHGWFVAGESGKGVVVLMHGNRKVSTKNLARQIGAKSVEPCAPEVANRHSGYQVGGTSPFATRKSMPVYVEETVLDLPKILINGGRRGYLVGLDPQLCLVLLSAKKVQCALPE